MSFFACSLIRAVNGGFTLRSHAVVVWVVVRRGLAAARTAVVGCCVTAVRCGRAAASATPAATCAIVRRVLT